MLPPVFPIVLYNGDRRWTASEAGRLSTHQLVSADRHTPYEPTEQ